MTLPHPADDSFLHPFGAVRHYYGDTVRALFVALAVVIGLAVPLSPDLAAGTLVGVPAILALLVLAGLTNPHGKSVLVLNALASGAGVVLSQVFALGAYGQELFPLFAFLELISVLFMASLYFSVKNVRAMAAGKIGRIDGVGEFDEQDA